LILVLTLPTQAILLDTVVASITLAALPSRAEKAREEVAGRLKPKAQLIMLPDSTLETEAELDKYLVEKVPTMETIAAGKSVVLSI
jgi:hypothetical protein